MGNTMADKQYQAAYKAAGDKIGNELFIYETTSDQWIRLVNNSDIELNYWIDFYEQKGFDIVECSTVAFYVRKRSLIKAGA